MDSDPYLTASAINIILNISTLAVMIGYVLMKRLGWRKHNGWRSSNTRSRKTDKRPTRKRVR